MTCTTSRQLRPGPMRQGGANSHTLRTAVPCLPAGATARALLGRGCRGLLKVVVRGEVLQEVALLLHDAVELVRVDRTVAVTVSLVDHVLELLVVNGLAELLRPC